MDWKIPLTIIILTVVVSLGIIPFFSPQFSNSLEGILDNVGNIFENLFKKDIKFDGEINFSLSTKELDKIKIGTPTKMEIKTNEQYELKLDKKNIIVKEDINFNNFTGLITFKNFSILGKVSKISTPNFEIEGSSEIGTSNQNFKTLYIENLKIGELTLANGNLDTESPQKMSANINDTIVLYGFQGSLEYKDKTITIKGNCTKIETKSFILGE
ncbi:MAG TPA: hypothetical protein EYP80_01150 [Candidatus Aenigmarchaeota archaeon]|nr:hypothetical protein [Candidatus Aenigmarchaeota archaeon]